MTLSEYAAHPTTTPDIEQTAAAGDLLAVAALDDLSIDTPIRIDVAGRTPIMVVRTADGVFAVDDTCSHQDTSLSAGWIEDCAVECPLHEACFDLRTGAAMGPPATRPIATHPVQVVDGLVASGCRTHTSPPTRRDRHRRGFAGGGHRRANPSITRRHRPHHRRRRRALAPL